MLGYFKSRQSLSSAIIFFYFAPLLLVIGAHHFLPEINSWMTFGLGLLTLSMGTLTLYTLLAAWEVYLRQQSSSLTPATATDTVSEVKEISPTPQEEEKEQEEKDETITLLLEQKNAELQSIMESQEEFRLEMEQSTDLLKRENQSLIEQLAHKEQLFEQAEQTINELRGNQDRKQQRNTQLETKVRDLSYEIKTLLQLTEIPEAPSMEKQPILPIQETAQLYGVETKKLTRPQEKQVHNQEEASLQLKRCIDIAQKMTGASHYSSTNSRFRGIPVDNFALDLRCLFDSLRSENSCTILVYSPKEGKPLFANDQIRKLTGWSPEKFVQNFDHIVQEGQEEWLAAIKQLSSQSSSKVRLILKSRSGEDTIIHGLLGTIPTGIFRHHIVVLLYTADHRHTLSSNT